MSNDKSSSTMPVINQKEYLKKYLNIGADKNKKKKKKRPKGVQNRVKIIDDNIDVLTTEVLTVNELDEFLTQEDAPQVVGMIDDRPLALRLDDYRKNSKWKLVGSDDEHTNSKSELLEGSKAKSKHKYDTGTDRGPPERSRNRGYDSDLSPTRIKRNSDSDASPPRRNKRNSDESPPRRKENKRSDSETSPPRKINRNVSSPPRRSRKTDLSPSRIKQEFIRNSDSDASPLRRNNKSDSSPLRKRNNQSKNYDSDASPPRKSHKSDLSPPRIKQRNLDSDASPPRRKNTDLSPPRKRNQLKNIAASPPRKSYKSNLSPPRKCEYIRNPDSDSDASPPRKSNSGKNTSPPQRNNLNKDSSPSRRKSPTRVRKSRWAEPSPPRMDQSPPRRRNSNTDLSPKRTSKERYSSRHLDRSPIREKRSEKSAYSNDRNRNSYDSDRKYNNRKEFSPGPSTSKKMEKTLDGKAAGLQNARDLKHETVAFKKREDDLFKKMSEEVSGMNAAPIIRDRKTGKKRDFEQEAMEEFAKLKKDKEQKQKYGQWGKGLKQVDDLKDKIESDLHEMSKPLARYADDEDLEAYLKEQERDGDPMLQYMRSKKKKQAVAEGKPMKPVYEGEFMPNRFGVPPGHRWDGVDRSNGYEKQWFAKENAKKAVEEEIYKWSTEDM